MNTRYTLADLVIDLEQKSACRKNKSVVLTDLSFGVLAAIVESAPNPISVEELALSVWNTPHVSDETITQRVKLLRRALNDDHKAPKYIKTVRNAGYVCAAPVRALNEKFLTPATRRRKKILVACSLTLALAGIAIAWNALTVDTSGIAKPGGPVSIVTSLVERAQDQLQVQQAKETDRAIELLHHAFVLDESNPRVQVGLSFALSTRATKFRAADGDAMEAEAMARRALLSHPRMGSAWHALGYSLDAQGRVDEALSLYRRAFELDPFDLAAESSAAYLLSIRGRLFESLTLEARAMESDEYSRYADSQISLVLDLIEHPAAHSWRSRSQLLNPNQVVVLAEVAESYLRRGNPDAALEVLAKASRADADSPRLIQLKGRAALLNGEVNNARVEFAAAGDRAASDLAALAAMSGSKAGARQQIELAEIAMLEGDSWPGLRVEVAELYGALGDDKAAVDLLSRAVDLGWRDIGTVEYSPFLQRTTKLKAWITVRLRIERELSIQRASIESSPQLVRFLNERS